MKQFQIGLDLDNTIILYEELFSKVARELKLLPDNFVFPPSQVCNTKIAIREYVREHAPHGDKDWNRIQAQVYGPGIADAHIAPGFIEFVDAMRSAGHSLCIISEKSEYAKADKERSFNLRTGAISFMERNGFFDPLKLRFKREEVFFNSTREEKIDAINALSEIYIDDLIEVLIDTKLDPTVARILYGARSTSPVVDGFAHWSDITNAILKTDRSTELSKAV